MISLSNEEILSYKNKYASFTQEQLAEAYCLAIEEKSFRLVKFFIVHSDLKKESLSRPLFSSLKFNIALNNTVENICDDEDCLKGLHEKFAHDIFLFGLEFASTRFLNIAINIAKEPITENHFNWVKLKHPQNIDFFNNFVELCNLNKTLSKELHTHNKKHKKESVSQEKKIKI